jgi:ribosomal protein S18 acetylase RimI-like enzyme
MPSVKLVEMTTEEFTRRREPMVRQYAQVTAAAGGMTVVEAEALAERETARSLPDGPRSAGELLRTAWVDGEEVGWIWVSRPGRLGPGLAWIDDILVDEKYRSHGHGQAIIEAIEAELVEAGVPRLGLNVFGDNDVARRLYERLGFEVIQQQRSRPLGAVPVAVESPVALGPMTSACFQRRMESFVASMVADYPTLTVREAHERAWKPLPHGLDTEDISVGTVVAADAEVGWVCYGRRAPNRPGMGWLHRLDIDPAYRGRGYGTAAVQVVEADLASCGVGSLGVAVAGGNHGARRLAERLGYTLTAQQMEKNLPVR